MYTLLGERFAGWPGALIALSIGTLVPAVIAVTLAVAYVTYSDYPLARDAMQGARAGALAVFSWAVVSLLRPQIQEHRGRGVALALVTLTMTLVLPLPPFVILLIAGGLGAAFLSWNRERSCLVLSAAPRYRAFVQRLCVGAADSRGPRRSASDFE